MHFFETVNKVLIFDMPNPKHVQFSMFASVVVPVIDNIFYYVLFIYAAIRSSKQD